MHILLSIIVVVVLVVAFAGIVVIVIATALEYKTNIHRINFYRSFVSLKISIKNKFKGVRAFVLILRSPGQDGIIKL